MNGETVDILITGTGIGTILPLIMAIIIQPGWRSEVKGVVAFVICCVAGVFVAWLQGDITEGQDVAAGIVSVLTVSQTLYATYWRPSGVAPAIERATSGDR